MSQFGLPKYDTGIITSDVNLVKLFEHTVEICNSPKDAANWIMGELMKMLNDTGTLSENMSFNPDSLGKMCIRDSVYARTVVNGARILRKILQKSLLFKLIGIASRREIARYEMCIRDSAHTPRKYIAAVKNKRNNNNDKEYI